jgi:hypothetical protein
VPPGSLRDGRCSFDLYRRRIDFRDPAKAIGLRIVRPGDERPAYFRAVPAGYDAKPKRLFRLDVTRREILYEHYDFQVGARSFERLEVSDHSEMTRCSAIVGEPGKISKYSGDKIAMMSISGSQLRGI